MAPLIIQGWRGTNPSRRSRRQSISSSVFIRVHPWLYKQERLVPHCHVRQRRLTRLGMKPRKRLTASRAATEYRYEKLTRSEEHTSELQSRLHLVCRLLLEKKKKMVESDVPETGLEHSTGALCPTGALSRALLLDALEP